MKVSDYTLEFLADAGIADVFMVHGGAIGELDDAFTRTTRTRYVAVMHEQGGGFAAEGYAKISGRPSAMIVTSGPGAQNIVTSLANFYYDSVPGVFISGQVPIPFQRPHESIRQAGFQEAATVDIVKPVTKYATMLRNPADIRFELQKAFHIAQEGRPGPVLIDMPSDVQAAEIDPSMLRKFTPPSLPPWNLSEIDRQIDRYIQDLKASTRPVVLVGGGIRNANALEEIVKLRDKIRAPFFPTWNATDVITSDSPFYGGRIGTYGGKGRNFGVQNSDLLLGLATRLTGRITGGRVNSFARGARKYIVNVDKPELDYHVLPLDEKIYSDAKIFLERLLSRLKGEELPDFSRWNEEVSEWRNNYDPVRPEHAITQGFIHPYHFMRVLSQEMQPGDIVVGDCGGNIIVSNHAFETKQGQRTLTNNGNSPMGFSFAGAMGAWLASDKRHNVVCTIGDGGFIMNLQELQTLVNYGIPTKTFVVDNHVYGLTRQTHRNSFNGRTGSNGPEEGYKHGDYAAITEAFGVKAFKLREPHETKSIIRQVLEYKGPAVCIVENGLFDEYAPRVFGPRPIEDQRPHLSREEFRENMKYVPPLPGWEDISYPLK